MKTQPISNRIPMTRLLQIISFLGNSLSQQVSATTLGGLIGAEIGNQLGNVVQSLFGASPTATVPTITANLIITIC
jgi:hypothetical protein